MVTSEFQQHFGNITAENFSAITAKWLDIPAYPELSTGLRVRAEKLTHLEGAVGVFVDHHKQAVSALVKQNQYFEALKLVDQRLEDAERMFAGDDLITARIFTHRRRGWIKEHWASIGELSKYPLGDSMRTLCFVGGAMDYMQADLELGCVTDYAGRISECFGGAGMYDLQGAAIVKLFGENAVIVGANSIDALIIRDMASKAIETKNIGSVPSGGDAKIITIPVPNPQLN